MPFLQGFESQARFLDSQRGPKNPLLHLHFTKPSSPTKQVPSFLHGLIVQPRSKKK